MKPVFVADLLLFFAFATNGKQVTVQSQRQVFGFNASSARANDKLFAITIDIDMKLTFGRLFEPTAFIRRKSEEISLRLPVYREPCMLISRLIELD